MVAREQAKNRDGQPIEEKQNVSGKEMLNTEQNVLGRRQYKKLMESSLNAKD